jgi:hypothetical protein
MFNHGEAMWGFDVSPDGKQIVFDRSRNASDIVLIELPDDMSATLSSPRSRSPDDARMPAKAMDVAVSRRRFTWTTTTGMGEAGILSPTDRVELIDGEIVSMTPIRSSARSERRSHEP